MIAKFGRKKLETSFYCTAQSIFRYVDRLGVTHESRVWQTIL